MERLKNLVTHIESDQIPLSYAFVTFLSAVMLRTFWEHTLLVRDPSANDWGADHTHFLFFYMALALSLILLLYGFTREKIARIARVVFPGFIFLSIVPLLDRFSGAMDSFYVTYYFPEKHPDILQHFLLFFGPLEETGATPGMRIEVALILAMIAVYVFIKTQRISRAVLAALASYILIFAYLAAPFIIEAVGKFLNVPTDPDMSFFIRLDLLLIFPLAMIVFYLARPDIFKAVCRDMRWMRLVHYFLLIVLGAVVCYRYFPGQVAVGQEGGFRVFFLLISVSLAWAFSVITNNLADEAIDRVSNPGRPSVTGAVPADLYRRIGWGCLWGAGIYALGVNAATLEIMAVFMGAYFIYSMPPIRFKRVTVLSKFVIGFNSLLMFMLGYMFWANATMIQLPFILFFLLFFTLTANFIDIKDHEGDRLAGVRTLPVVLGPLWAKRLIGMFFIITYLAAYETFMMKGFFWVCFVTGIVQCVLVNRKHYDERPVFVVHLLSLLFIIGYVVWTTGRGY